MKWTEIFRMGFGNLLRRKTRTLLTITGVVIGAASIIVMLSIGFGMKSSMRAQLGSTATLTIINVSEQTAGDAEAKAAQKKKAVLDDKAVAVLGELDNVVAVTPQKTVNAHFICGRRVADIPLIGIDSSKMEQFGFKMKSGNLITPGANEIVIGHNALYNFHDPKRTTVIEPDESQPPPVNVLKDKLQVSFDPSYEEKRRLGDSSAKAYNVRAVGVNVENSEYSWNAYMDLADLTKLLNESKKDAAKSIPKKEKYDMILVKADEVENVLPVQEAIIAMGYKTFSSADYVKSVEEMFNTLQLALGGIGAISLIVAAIGITNTMIMSIYERTREIGVMKVVGAAIKDIRSLFLLESGLIGLGGGLLGAAVSYLASSILNLFAGVNPFTDGAPISVIPFWLTPVALGVSFLIGILSGYLPARRAMKLSALQAIKAE
ncbi:MAG: ABC transporter permease [Gracilibacteraceae bacterium]|jgi:ABC-type antimicrobial peptide transport system permease subunit|nr:ABC transporter permease [Gracilibacteraceae bacterium]